MSRHMNRHNASDLPFPFAAALLAVTDAVLPTGASRGRKGGPPAPRDGHAARGHMVRDVADHDDPRHERARQVPVLRDPRLRGGTVLARRRHVGGHPLEVLPAVVVRRRQ
jgi:hypothetical protein